MSVFSAKNTLTWQVVSGWERWGPRVEPVVEEESSGLGDKDPKAQRGPGTS